jgi:hypothetical protein
VTWGGRNAYPEALQQRAVEAPEAVKLLQRVMFAWRAIE